MYHKSLVCFASYHGRCHGENRKGQGEGGVGGGDVGEAFVFSCWAEANLKHAQHISPTTLYNIS